MSEARKSEPDQPKSARPSQSQEESKKKLEEALRFRAEADKRVEIIKRRRSYLLLAIVLGVFAVAILLTALLLTTFLKSTKTRAPQEPTPAVSAENAESASPEEIPEAAADEPDEPAEP
ncbi:MAG: hypothetical protein IK077_17175 [Thermoguttaceae bacterium]|nr:hypothetical protein [Thermoguttaceae bacterium]